MAPDAAEPHISNAEYLLKVRTLLQASQNTRSSVYFTQKRLVPFDPIDGKQTVGRIDDPLITDDTKKDTQKYSILLRATNGSSEKDKKLKYSTIVKSDDLDQFWKDYAIALKGGMTGLKKKDKKRNKKRNSKK
ncbi:RNA-binding signal recognition particle subunit SRP14 [Ascoidea rubescens DSM 1968]|uniref:Signal recognition particle subunit SRP14 n=1 Tax=Ascoidea rubescens DSM 1968 TaxID=1344418 RepID=A0A1D2VL47_9ASCO|nr:signal recognition particle, SRP9/SRP14 subunit [Ascoidea rubescens DSM 1968]ODV62277.1 signal recognition particle, SRP9/SRP14 subunit [Ascoidea rubescens DSM 1968]